jgi:hypothetical protein
MPFAENFHPEWGVLAPAPSVVRTMRIVLVATAIGATAGAGTVIALMDRPAPEATKIVQTAPAMAMLATPPGVIAVEATTPSASEAPAAAAALNELNSAAAAPPPPAPDRIDVASQDGAAATPQAPEPALVREPPSAAPAIAAVEAGAAKAAVKKPHKTVHRRQRSWDGNAYGERRYDRGYNTAYRQW